MSCRKRFLFIPSLCLFFSLFFSFLLEKNSFAVSDLTVNFSANTSYSGAIFSTCNDLSCLSQYRYLIFSSSSYTSYNFQVQLGSTGNRFTYPSAYVDYLVVSLPSNSSLLQFYNAVSASSDFSFTLTDSLPGSSAPSGTLPISSNGQYDVTQYEYVDVNVENEVIQGDYHDDLVSIKHAIITCGGVILVLYFFYCIYRMIIKNSGVH